MPEPSRALRGHDYLIPRHVQETSPAARLLVGEVAVLTNRLIEEANQRIIEDFRPTRDRVILSLCTSTRPYYRSRKWKVFMQAFGKDADMVICSNGGVIPMQYAQCYPFMEYDAHRDDTGAVDDLYGEVMHRRLTEFFAQHHWEHVVHVFGPKSRNARFLREWDDVPGVLVPDAVTSRAVWELPGMAYRMQPLTAPLVLDAMADALALPRRALVEA